MKAAIRRLFSRKRKKKKQSSSEVCVTVPEKGGRHSQTSPEGGRARSPAQITTQTQDVEVREGNGLSGLSDSAPFVYEHQPCSSADMSCTPHSCAYPGEHLEDFNTHLCQELRRQVNTAIDQFESGLSQSLCLDRVAVATTVQSMRIAAPGSSPNALDLEHWHARACPSSSEIATFTSPAPVGALMPHSRHFSLPGECISPTSNSDAPSALLQTLQPPVLMNEEPSSVRPPSTLSVALPCPPSMQRGLQNADKGYPADKEDPVSQPRLQASHSETTEHESPGSHQTHPRRDPLRDPGLQLDTLHLVEASESVNRMIQQLYAEMEDSIQLQMASLRAEMGCTGEASERQWRHACFQNLPVPVNLDRLAAFVGSRHFFRAFLTNFHVDHKLQSCSSPTCGTSFLESGPAYTEAAARSRATRETHWTCNSDCSNRSSSFCSCHRISHDEPSLERGESYPGSVVGAYTASVDQHKLQDAMRGSLESVDGEDHSGLSSLASLPQQIVNSNTILGVALLQHLVCGTLPRKVSIRAILQLFQTVNVARGGSLWNVVAVYVSSMLASLSSHEVILLVSSFLHNVLFSLPESPEPSQQQLATTLEPLEIMINALRPSAARRSSVHDQLYIGQSGSLAGDSSNLLEFTVLCFSSPAACTRTLHRHHAFGDHTSSGAPEDFDGSNFSLNAASATSVPHEFTAQALVHLITMQSNPVWLSAFLLPAAIAAVQDLDAVLLSKILAAASHVVDRVLSLKRSQTENMDLGAVHSNKTSQTFATYDLAISGSVSQPEGHAHHTESSTQCPFHSHRQFCSQEHLSSDTADLKCQSQIRGRQGQGHNQSPKAPGCSLPEVCPEMLLQAATVSCIRAQSAAQHSAAFAVLQRISGDLTVAFRQECETCCAFIACRKLFAAVPGPCSNDLGSSHTAEKPLMQEHHTHLQGTAMVQIRSCSDSWSLGSGTYTSCNQNHFRVLLGARCTVQHPSATTREQGQYSPMMALRRGQISEWSITAVANTAEVFKAQSGTGHNLGMHVKLCSHRSGCRNTKMLVMIVPDISPTDYKSTHESCMSWTLPEESSVPLRLRGSGSPSAESVVHRSADRHFFGQRDGSTGKVSTMLDDSPRHPAQISDRTTTQQHIAEALQSLKSLTMQGARNRAALSNELLLHALSQVRTSARAPVAGQLLNLKFCDVGEGMCCEEFVFFDDAARSDWHAVHGVSSKQTWNWWVGKVVNIFCVIDDEQ